MLVETRSCHFFNLKNFLVCPDSNLYMSEISPTFVVRPLSNFCIEVGAPPLPFFSDLSNFPCKSWPVSTIFSSTTKPQSLQITSPIASSYVRFMLSHSGQRFTKAILEFHVILI